MVNKTMKPLVTILTTSYNYANYVGQTVQSILDQTYTNWELLICDDGSSDHSVEVLRSFKDPRITLIEFPENRGVYTAYTTIFQKRRGTYLVNLDSDDWISPDRIQSQVEALETNTKLDIVRTQIREIDSSGNLVGDSGAYQQWFNHQMDLNQIESWIWSNRLCHSSVMMRANVFDELSHNPRFSCAPDYEFWVRCLRAGKKFGLVDKGLTYYRGHGSNVTHKNIAQTFLEVLIVTRDQIIPQAIAEGKWSTAASALQALRFHPYYKEANSELKHELFLNLFNDLKFGSSEQIREFENRLLQLISDLGNDNSQKALELADKNEELLRKQSELSQKIAEHEMYKNRFLVKVGSRVHTAWERLKK